MAEDRKPWSYIGHDGTCWWCLLSASVDADQNSKESRKWRKTIAAEIGDWVVSGLQVKTCYSREDHKAFLDTMEMGESPREKEKANG